MSTADGAEYPRNLRHYYEDGNFILLVNNHVFRIYKGLLARRSEVFSGLFELPQAPDVPNAPQREPSLFFDGVPAVVLDDNHETFAILLDLLFPSSSNVALNYTMEETIALLLLCDKYEVEDIRKDALDWLRRKLPVTIADIPNIRTVYAEPSTAFKVLQSTAVVEMRQYVPLASYALASHQWACGEAATEEDLMKPMLEHTQIHASLSSAERFWFDVARQSYEARAMSEVLCMAKMHGKVFLGCKKAPRSCLAGGAPPLLVELLTNDISHFPLEALDKAIKCDRSEDLCTFCASSWEEVWVAARGAIFAIVQNAFDRTNKHISE